MASILRSSKFVRYIAGFARNVVWSTPREFDGNLVNTTQCLCGAIPRSFASQFSAQQDQSLEHSLRRIDQDVRKSGRISRRDIEDVLEEIRSTRTATSSQSLLVIRCCGNLVPEELPEVRTKLVQEIWSTLHKLNVPMDISHYNALLRVYLENEHQFSPTNFLADLESKGIEPNRVTYQRLISRYCQVGDIEGATKILEFMREKQLPVNENVFNALIIGHSQAGDMDSAQGILGVMTQAGLEPSADTYTTLLCGYAKKGDIESINKYFEECNVKEVHLLDKDYLDIVYALATNGHNAYVPEILTKVRRAMGYNQDAINLILRLINKGQEESALLVMKSMVRGNKDDGTVHPLGNFFIKQLVKANRPVDTIVEICNNLEVEGMYDRGLSLAAETSLQLGNDKLAYSLMNVLSAKDVTVRQHFFWPLIIAKSKQKSSQGVMEVLNNMQKFNVYPSLETLRDYVIPNLKVKSSEIIELLREANISPGTSASCLVHHLLQKNKIQEAAEISSTVDAYYNPELLRKSLTIALYETKNVAAYIKVLRNIYENLERKLVHVTTDEQAPETDDKVEIIGKLVTDLTYGRREFFVVIPSVLQGLIDEGLSISTSAAEKIQEKLAEKMTDEISSLLGKLTSGDLIPVPVAKKLPVYTPSSQMNVAQLERLIHNLRSKSQDTRGLQRQLLSLYHREKDLEKTEALVADLEKDVDFTFTSGIYAQLADIYAYHDNLEKSLFYFEKLKNSQDEIKMDESKIIRIAHMLVKHNKLDDALNLLGTTFVRDTNEEKGFAYISQVWRFLNSVAEEGRTEDLYKIFDTLTEHDYIGINNVLLGPLIKVHLVNNHLDKALDKFEECVKKYKSTPWKNELACQLIQAEDAEKLQKLTDLSTAVHGEINSLYDLVFAFVECGRIRQARKILETPGLQNRPQRINTVCERYRQEGSVKSLEGLKDATKDLNHIDRSEIYYQLLLSYIKQNEADKALGLWTQMQEEDLLPTDQFLNTLGNFLKTNDYEVPFIVPNLAHEQKKPPTQSIRLLLKSGDLDGALNSYKKNEVSFPAADVSALIEKLIQADRVREATKITINSLDKKQIPLSRVLRFLLNKLAAAGDVNSLNSIGSRISQDVKRNISFDNRLCHATLIAGKGEEYLSNLDRDIENAKDEDLPAIAERFPRGGAYGILERHPELVEKYEDLAIKYGKRGIAAPLNVLWTNYFISGNDAKAEEIWNTYLKDAPRIMFQRVVHAARDNKDEVLIQKLITHLKVSNVTEGAIGNAYSCLLDVLVTKEKYQEVVEKFENALQDVGVDHINRTAVLRVKEVYGKLEKPFDHKIPPKNPKNNATSSSSSEDDKKN